MRQLVAYRFGRHVLQGAEQRKWPPLCDEVSAEFVTQRTDQTGCSALDPRSAGWFDPDIYVR